MCPSQKVRTLANSNVAELFDMESLDQKSGLIHGATANIDFWSNLMKMMMLLSHSHPASLLLFAISIKYLSRFFDCLAHPNQSATVGTDQKWPKSHLRITYQV